MSVSRFSNFLLLWRYFKSLWQVLEDSFSSWQYFESTLAIFHAIGQIFIVVNGHIVKNNLAIWSHWPLYAFGDIIIHSCVGRLDPKNGNGIALKTFF